MISSHRYVYVVKRKKPLNSFCNFLHLSLIRTQINDDYSTLLMMLRESLQHIKRTAFVQFQIPLIPPCTLIHSGTESCLVIIDKHESQRFLRRRRWRSAFPRNGHPASWPASFCVSACLRGVPTPRLRPIVLSPHLPLHPKTLSFFLSCLLSCLLSFAARVFAHTRLCSGAGSFVNFIVSCTRSSPVATFTFSRMPQSSIFRRCPWRSWRSSARKARACVYWRANTSLCRYPYYYSVFSVDMYLTVNVTVWFSC